MMDFSAWLHSWLKRHPLKPLDHIDQSQYTAEVMSRIKAQPATQPAYRVRSAGVWLPWPRLALAVATAAAGAAIALTVFRAQPLPQVADRSTSPAALALMATEDAELLAELEEGTADFLIDNGDTLDRALETTDALMLLAEAPGQGDEQWLEETMQLLDQLDEDVSSDDEEGSDDDWLDDLQLLDETDLAASS